MYKYTWKKILASEGFFFSVLFLYFVITFILFYNQTLTNTLKEVTSPFPSDMWAYMKAAFDDKWRTTIFSYPLLFWIIRAIGNFTQNQMATALGTALLNLLTPLTLRYIWNKNVKNNKKDNNWMCTLFVFSLLFVSSIFISSFSKYRYLGQGTPNVWHNATSLATKPFSYMSFFLFILIWNNYKKKITMKDFLAFTVFLFFSVLAKPSFAFVFVPVAAIIFTWDLFINKCKYLKESIFVFLTFVPSFILLIWQYNQTFSTNNQIKIGFLRVWKTWSPNIFISIILSLIFPIFIYITNFKKFQKNKIYIGSLILLLNGLLQCMFLYEPNRVLSGNFFWGYYIAIGCSFISCLIIFIKTFKKKNIYYKILGSIFYNLHLLSGLTYFIKIFIGKTYT